MYIPCHNEETRIPVMHELIRAYPLAALITFGTDGLFASHIPMVLHLNESTDAPEAGTLRGHVSRANVQWSTFEPAVEALAIFSGPEHYITPNWYPGKLEHGKEVPTWNYAVVHAKGPLRVIHDPSWLLTHLEALTDQSEADSTLPWRVSDAPADFIQTMMKGIVGFELPIRALEGKWKVSQNRTVEDKLGVLDGLGHRNTFESLSMRALVESRMAKDTE